MKLISICVPVYNEQDNITNLINKVDLFFKKKKKYDYEIVFSDNDSNDKTEKIIQKICYKNKKIKYIRFKKNVGYDFSVFYNIILSNGDASVVLDCDLQDPINKILEFLNYWEKGFDLVYGIRERKNEKDLFHFFRKNYYKILHKFSKNKYPLYAGDFRLIDKKIRKQFNLKKKNETIVTRCISFDYSKKKYGVSYNRVPRKLGYSKYPFFKSLKYALNTFILKTNLFEELFKLMHKSLFVFNILLFGLIQNFKILILIFLTPILLNIIYIYLKKIHVKKHLRDKNRILISYKINF